MWDKLLQMGQTVWDNLVMLACQATVKVTERNLQDDGRISENTMPAAASYAKLSFPGAIMLLGVG